MKSLKDLPFPEGALLVCLALAGLFGLFAVLGYWEDSRFLANAVPTEGRVMRVLMRTEIERNKNGPDYTHHYYLPVVEFSDPQNRRVEFRGRYDTHLEDQWKTGMAVKVLFTEDNPAEARIDDPSQIHASYRIWRNMAVIAVVVGALLFGLGKYEARPKRPVYESDEEARRAYFGG